ncbi:uncharacterized protein LOC135466928 [Liolophura sinensis]|uniref:uncharacterized protein LOC135466928 n=1 Tax=Liolophura sinensis TaxID=3198878 RepID=UPI00315960E0
MDKALYPILIVQTILYLAAFISGFAASISIGLTNTSLAGFCVFSVILDKSNNYYVNPELAASCQYPMAVAICTCITAGLAMAVFNVFKLCTQVDRLQILLLPEILLNGIVSLMLLVSACLVSVGFSNFCHYIEVGEDIDNFRCEQMKTWDDISFDGLTVSLKNIYQYLSVAQGVSHPAQKM